MRLVARPDPRSHDARRNQPARSTGALLVALLLGSTLVWSAPTVGEENRILAHDSQYRPGWHPYGYGWGHRKHRPRPQPKGGVLRFIRDPGGKHKSVYAANYASRRWLVELDAKAVSRDALMAARKLDIQLLPRRRITVSQRSFEDRGESGYSWIGRVNGDPGGYLIITRVEDKVGIRAMVRGRSYLMIPLNDGSYEMMRLRDVAFPTLDGPDTDLDVKPPLDDGARFPRAFVTALAAPDGPLVLRKLLIREAIGDRQFYPLIEDGSAIDVMMVFTPHALERAWLAAANADLADVGDLNVQPAEVFLVLLTRMAFDLANLSLANSGIPTHFHFLSNFYELDYSESDLFPTTKPAEQMIADLASAGDGEMDDVHALRNRHAADIVVLVTGSLRSEGEGRRLCGWSTKTREKFNGLQWADQDELEAHFAARAFALVRIDCLSQLTLAHEIGHLMGARHDRYVYPDPPNTTQFENYGFGFTLHEPSSNQAVRTVMAYPDECLERLPGVDCPLVPRWSNPGDTTQFGLPLGIDWGFADAADNARVLTKNREAVSRYRWWGCRIVDCSP